METKNTMNKVKFLLGNGNVEVMTPVQLDNPIIPKDVLNAWKSISNDPHIRNNVVFGVTDRGEFRSCFKCSLV
jgi:hypothetical protein